MPNCRKNQIAARANNSSAVFESFLSDFKTSGEQTITTAIGDIQIDEDDLSDEYDFMDEDDEAQARRQRDKERRRKPQHKYKEILQQLADRKIDEIVIDLDDLASVCGPVRVRLSAHCATNSSAV